MYADELIRPWFDALVDAVPELKLFDAHTHTGQSDPDGFTCAPEELTAALVLADARAVVFTQQEPAGYPPANDRVLAEAAAADGRLVPFCRLDPHRDPVGEALRCLDAGARGIKLHPRAERFAVGSPPVWDVFALAHERRLPVLIHAGRGIPALGRDVVTLLGEFPDVRVILAHAGISDLAWIWRELEHHPNLFFDTAWWNPSDLLALFTLAPPGHILFASDAPYGTPTHGAVMALRCALQAGLSPEQVRGVAGGQLERLLARDEPLDLGPAPGVPTLDSDVLLERVFAFLVSAIGVMIRGGRADEQLALARLACEVGDDAAQAPTCRSVLALLDRQERYLEDPAPEGGHFPGVHLTILAACVARTPLAPLPSSGLESVSVGDRSA